jgi:hypothetical protein
MMHLNPWEHTNEPPDEPPEDEEPFITLVPHCGISTRYMPVLMEWDETTKSHKITKTKPRADKGAAILLGQAWAEELGVEFR